MFKRLIILLVAACLVGGLAADTCAAITKVARRLNVFSISGGYALPVGSYNSIYDNLFVNSQNLVVSVDAGDIYDPSHHFGLNYGQLRISHIFFGVGFRWTKINVEDSIWVDPITFYQFVPVKPSFNQYDLGLDLNWFFKDPSQEMICPYLGLGFQAGVTSVSHDLIETDNELTFSLGVNFGIDLTVWHSADNRSQLALSSVNDWVFTASNDRPKYLNFGAAVKYYFRP